MLVDVLIAAFAISSLYRGREIGLVRQLGSTIGFFAGLFLGAGLQPHIVPLAHSQASRALLAITTTLTCALILLTLGEALGIRLKSYVMPRPINRLDNGLGSVLSFVTVLLSAWLFAAVLRPLPFPNLQTAIRNSYIITHLNAALPSAPAVVADLGHLINPNGFPEVFLGPEPNPNSTAQLPSSNSLAPAVEHDQASVVKIEGSGCGGIVEGSGFVVGPNLVVTNAHVVAGVGHPFIEDSNGTHRSSAIWFNPNLDLAILRTNNLAGSILNLSDGTVNSKTAAAVLGYPGGGGFRVNPAVILDEFVARGRNIYNQGSTSRDVYEVQADIIPGNSGGPVITADGTVVGVVFAQSTTYSHVGYALSSPTVKQQVSQAAARNQTVDTGSCAE